MACPHCQELNLTHAIGSPRELRDAVRVVRANLADDTLIESTYWPPGEIRPDQSAFARLDTAGPLPDVPRYYFECPRCRQLFELCCETYHGSGGHWAPAERDS